MPVRMEQTDAYEIIRGGTGNARVVLTCEHATNRLPEPYAWDTDDRWLVNTHWALDLGIAGIARDLADELGATLVLSRFSRLLVDPNRHPTAPDRFREVADGRFVNLNLELDAAEREARMERFYRPYHAAIDEVMARTEGIFLLSLHSFTPVYEGAPPRWMDIGILFDDEDALAEQLVPVVRRHGLVTALNEPYSGKGGMMFAAQSHADAFGWHAIEIEVRQDRAINPGYRRQIVNALADMTRCAVDTLDHPMPSFTEEVARSLRE